MWESLLNVAAHAFFLLGLLAGLVIIPFGLPGTFVIAGMALAHGLFTGFEPVTLKFLLLLLALSGIGELVEFYLGAAAARRYGGSRWAMWGAILGGILGAVYLTAIMPLLGTILGAFIGAFIGAAVFEYLRLRDGRNALRAGYGALLGALGGRATKLVLAIAMVVMTLQRVW